VFQVRLSKILNLKKEKVCALKDMNTEAERKESVGETVAPDFQRRYARTILDLEELNTELNSLLVKVRQQCHEVSRAFLNVWLLICLTMVMLMQIAPDSEHGLSPLAGPDSIRQLCYQEARDMVETQIEGRISAHHVTSAPILQLITGLTSLMLQIKVSPCSSVPEWR
jgi:protein lin-9